MKIKPKEIFVNLPIVLMFKDQTEIPKLAANINQIIHGKIHVKYEEIGMLGDQYVGIFYLQRNDEFTDLRQDFIAMIEREEIVNYNNKIRKAGAIECDQLDGIGVCACGAWHIK